MVTNRVHLLINQEPRTKNQEPRSKIKDQRTKIKEPRTKIKNQRAWSMEQNPKFGTLKEDLFRDMEIMSPNKE